MFEGTPDLHRILPVALQVANAMHYLHEQGVVHGDLCPRWVLGWEGLGVGVGV